MESRKQKRCLVAAALLWTTLIGVVAGLHASGGQKNRRNASAKKSKSYPLGLQLRLLLSELVTASRQLQLVRRPLRPGCLVQLARGPLC